MKKMLTVLTAALMLSAVLLAGCTRDEPVPSTPTTQSEATVPTEVMETPAIPTEKDILYFVNEMEYNRLYSIREDGTDLKLVLDKGCYSVRQVGDTVYYMTGSALESYHIPTGEISVVVEDILDYALDGDKLVYRVMLDDLVGTTDLRCRDLSTGDEVSVFSGGWARFWLGFGRIYYVVYDMESSGEVLWMYDIQQGETIRIADDFYFYSTLSPVEEGAYFEASSAMQDGWFFASADGSGYEPVELPLKNLSELIQVSDDGILYLDWDVELLVNSLYHVDQDGKETVLMKTDGNSYLNIEKISDGHWLVQESRSIGWGDTNEYGYYEHYAYRTDYLLLTADGTLTPLNVTGEAGSLFSDGDFPLLDSSTARIPVTTALYQLFVKAYGYEGPEPLCSTTHGAWLNIADRKVDLALLAAPTPEEQAYLEEQGVTVEMKLYGGDGLVFIGNAANPVTDLTHEQILAIYRGEITNWSQVGGPDHEIIVYYRDEQSGSQRLFRNLVFKGLEVPDFEAMNQEGRNVYLMDDMSSIVDVILSEPYAIGYSIMTYLDEVYAEDNLRVFSVEGTLPSPDTVADGTYLYHTQGYLVIRSDEPADSPARRLFDWFGCPVSDDLLTDCGVSPLHDANA